VVQAGLTKFRQNQYGQTSIKIGDSAYKTIAQPVMPYLARPYQYVSPYVEKADHIGDQTLAKMDERWPVVKKPADELYADAKSVVLYPLHKSMEGKDHVFSVYSAECKKVGGEGLVTTTKALISTAVLISSEAISWVGQLLAARKAEAKDAANDKVNG
jgi:hypothetical protein